MEPEIVGKSIVIGLKKENCVHQKGYYIEENSEKMKYIEFNYCPWCGTKVKEMKDGT